MGSAMCRRRRPDEVGNLADQAIAQDGAFRVRTSVGCFRCR